MLFIPMILLVYWKYILATIVGMYLLDIFQIALKLHAEKSYLSRLKLEHEAKLERQEELNQDNLITLNTNNLITLNQK